MISKYKMKGLMNIYNEIFMHKNIFMLVTKVKFYFFLIYYRTHTFYINNCITVKLKFSSDDP